MANAISTRAETIPSCRNHRKPTLILLNYIFFFFFRHENADWAERSSNVTLIQSVSPWRCDASLTIENDVTKCQKMHIDNVFRYIFPYIARLHASTLNYF